MNNLLRIITSCVLLASATPAVARDQLKIVGSSTVFPFIAAAAEQFAHEGKFRTPIAEINGTGGGFKMFCDGVGERYPDIANASRPIKDSEIALCKKHGVQDITEITLGYDGIVVANALSSASLPLTKELIFLALAREVPKDGKLAQNPYTRWREIDPKLPDVPIEVYGPPPAEGTRDAFVELVMHEACKEFPEYKTAYADDRIRQQRCGTLREDGRYIEVLGGNLMVQKLVTNTQALGIFSYSFLDQNRALVKANPIRGVMPSFASIVDRSYSVARSLFIYVKDAHVGTSPGLAEFSQFVTSDAASGEDGFLVIKGLIPLSAKDRKDMQARVRVLSTH
jgi:phosphate transport system substrate-binding protein